MVVKILTELFCWVSFPVIFPRKLALYKGDTRTRTIDIYVDGDKVTTWTSSGTTTGFESVELGAQGQVVELRGVLADSEWLSILEVGPFLSVLRGLCVWCNSAQL